MIDLSCFDFALNWSNIDHLNEWLGGAFVAFSVMSFMLFTKCFEWYRAGLEAAVVPAGGDYGAGSGGDYGGGDYAKDDGGKY